MQLSTLFTQRLSYNNKHLYMYNVLNLGGGKNKIASRGGGATSNKENSM